MMCAFHQWFFPCSYLGVMTAALEAGAKGADHRAAALGQVQRFVTCVDRLAQSLSQLQVRVGQEEEHNPG
jgi:hypothetical protein